MSYTASSAVSWLASQAEGGTALPAAASDWHRRLRSFFWHHQRLVQCPHRGANVERVDQQRVPAELVGRASLAGQYKRAAAVGNDRALLRNQVHAIAHRVDEQHVGEPVAGQRTRIVVVGAEQDRPPLRGAELVLDRSGESLHAGRVLPVFGQIVP